MSLQVAGLLIWVVAGVVTLCCENVPKISFIICWVTLLIFMVNGML
jgi:hypothetical protein